MAPERFDDFIPDMSKPVSKIGDEARFVSFHETDQHETNVPNCTDIESPSARSVGGRHSRGWGLPLITPQHIPLREPRDYLPWIVLPGGESPTSMVLPL